MYINSQRSGAVIFLVMYYYFFLKKRKKGKIFYKLKHVLIIWYFCQAQFCTTVEYCVNCLESFFFLVLCLESYVNLKNNKKYMTCVIRAKDTLKFKCEWIWMAKKLWLLIRCNWDGLYNGICINLCTWFLCRIKKPTPNFKGSAIKLY